jgi:hypothetical protein
MDIRKRKADASSPPRDNASSRIVVMDNDRKRRDLSHAANLIDGDGNYSSSSDEGGNDSQEEESNPYEEEDDEGFIRDIYDGYMDIYSHGYDEPNEDEDEAALLFDVENREKQQLKKVEQLRLRFPLRHEGIMLPDVECVAFYESFKSTDNSPAAWTAVDSSQKNILHHLSSRLHPESVRWLLANPDFSNTLMIAHDIEGYIPLEALQEQLDKNRSIVEWGTTVYISDTFRGFPPEAVNCLVALQQLENVTLSQLQRLKYGCTCGQCIDGFLSPRMKFLLLCQAELTNDMVAEMIDDGPEWHQWHNYIFRHAAPDVKPNFLYRQVHLPRVHEYFCPHSECAENCV